MAGRHQELVVDSQVSDILNRGGGGRNGVFLPSGRCSWKARRHYDVS